MREDRYVGIFYLLWMGQHGIDGPYDNSRIIAADPGAAFDESKWGPVQAFHFWGEPLFGYYTSDDEWVLRKHIKMLTNAGVDFLGMDATNAHTYTPQVLKLMKLLREYQLTGWNVPKVTFYTNTRSGATMNELYEGIYRAHPEYEPLWFRWDGKPLLVGIPDDPELMPEARDFSRIKLSQWPNQLPKDDGFPWISFERKPHVFRNAAGENEIVVVSPAQHPQINFAATAFYGHTDMNWPRTYHDGANDLSAGAIDRGCNFAEMFEYAIAQDPKIIFITEWNEWVAQRQPPRSKEEPIFFVDCADQNCSRDIEPMRGGFGDNYYMQMVKYIREFKGYSLPVSAGRHRTIEIEGPFSQWDDVTAVFTDYSNDLKDRHARGFGDLFYENTTGRNDFSVMKVAQDADNLYFYVRTVATITSPDGYHWMNLFLRTNGTPDWYGYDFALNRISPANGEMILEKCLGGWNWTETARIPFRLHGNEMHLRIPRNTLGFVSPCAFEFKWADNYQSEGDVSAFYADGDAAPLGRLNFIYSE